MRRPPRQKRPRRSDVERPRLRVESGFAELAVHRTGRMQELSIAAGEPGLFRSPTTDVPVGENCRMARHRRRQGSPLGRPWCGRAGRPALRVAYVIWLRNRGTRVTVMSNGRLISETTISTTPHWARRLPVILAWLVVLGAPSVLGLKSWLSHQLFTCLVGTATVFMSGLAGRAAFGRRVGLIAAAPRGRISLCQGL